MPARDYMRLSIQGSMPQGEVWSCGVAYRNPAAPDIADLDGAKAWATRVAAAFADSPSLLPQQPSQLLSQAVSIDNIRVTGYHLGKSLYYVDAPLSNPVFGSGSPTGPTTQALAVSLRTINQTRSGRGRFYWPAMRYPIDTQTGRFTKGALPGTLEQFRTMLVSIAALYGGGTPPTLIVTSAAGDSGGDVSELRMGDIVDSQRRRKDTLVESYAVRGFPA